LDLHSAAVDLCSKLHVDIPWADRPHTSSADTHSKRQAEKRNP
jgi:hypothetical protein